MRSDDLKAQIAAVAGQTDMAPYVSLKDQRRMTVPIFPPSQHSIARLIEPLLAGGLAGFVLANGSMSSNQSGEGEIRKAIIEADLVDCMVALPGQLFYSTQIPVCLWFLARNKNNGRFRDRRGETLFIDARKMGSMVDRVHRELTDEDTAKIAGTYHAWRGDKSAGEYADVPGFCKAATLDEIGKHGHVLTPGRYVGAEAAEDDGEPFEEKMMRLAAMLRGARRRTWRRTGRSPPCVIRSFRSSSPASCV
jgi:type I restriction enzyme M protein